MAIKIPAVKSTKLIQEPINEVTYPDGIIIKVKGANNETTRKPLYLAAYELANNAPPVITPPVIIPSPGSIRQMSLKEIQEVKDGIDVNENIEIKPVETADSFYFQNVRANINLSKVLFRGNKNVILEFAGDCSGIRLFGAQAKDNNEFIHYDIRDKVYTGKSGSFIDGFTIEGFNLDNTGQLFTTQGGGFQPEGTIKGVIKGFRFLNNTIKNHATLGQVIWAAYMEDALISGNIMDNLNTQNNNHNGIFSIWGLNGRVTGNRLTNHQGDLLRAIPCQLSSGKGLEIDNNTVAKSRWYSAIELQAHEVFMNPAFKPIASKIHHNTVVSLSMEKTREGQLFDEYNLGGGSSEIDYNLGGDLFTFASRGITNMINENFTNNRTIGKNNVYMKNASDAVDNNFKSKIAGVGAAL